MGAIQRSVCAVLVLVLSIHAVRLAVAQPSAVQPGVVERGEEKPKKPKSSPELVIPEISSPAPDDSFSKIRLTLREVAISGNVVIATPVLQAKYSALMGREVTLAQVFAATQEVTQLYADEGYALSLAYLPAQDIENGLVRVNVVEGYIEAVEIAAEDRDLASVLSSYGDKIRASRPLTTVALERYLLLANELPGVRVRSVIDKGAGAPGAMKLILRVDYDPWEASLSIDNRGTEALGPERGRVDLTANGLLSRRDRLTISYMRGLDGEELDYFASSFAVALNSEGTTSSVEISNTNSRPGTDALSAIEFETKGFVSSAKLAHPLIRSRAENLLGELSFTYKDLKGDILGLPNSDDRLGVLSLLAHYDLLDAWQGVSSLDLTLSNGLDVFDATKTSDPFPSRVGADATFTRIELSASRAQALDESFEFYVAAYGQYADSALLSSEQCGFGGARYGRAFDSFEIAGDNCAMGQVELRYRLQHSAKFLDYVQLFGFADAGWVERRGLVLPGEFDEARAQSAGAGVRFGMFEHADISFEYADPLGTLVALEGNDEGRVFFSLTIHR